jgi:methylmalonyl-CoA mutase
LIAQRPEGNLLEIAVDAARNRTTLGEISDALESLWKIQSYFAFYSRKKTIKVSKTKQIADIFAKQEGRRPRIMIAKRSHRGQKSPGICRCTLMCLFAISS